MLEDLLSGMKKPRKCILNIEDNALIKDALLESEEKKAFLQKRIDAVQEEIINIRKCLWNKVETELLRLNLISDREQSLEIDDGAIFLHTEPKK